MKHRWRAAATATVEVIKPSDIEMNTGLKRIATAHT